MCIRDRYDEVVGLAHLANICYIRQKETKGLGHAISCAKAFVGEEPFAVLSGDDVNLGEDHACGVGVPAREEGVAAPGSCRGRILRRGAVCRLSLIHI